VAGSAATEKWTPPIPVDVRVDGNTGLADGREVRLRVTAKPGSQIFGFEVFLCQGGVTFRNEADIRPTLAGKCASEPLSARSDSYQEVRAVPPYASVESTFRAGVGSVSFATRDSRQAIVTCGPGHPCQLALKLQFPDGFAFRALPLEYR